MDIVRGSVKFSDRITFLIIVATGVFDSGIVCQKEGRQIQVSSPAVWTRLLRTWQYIYRYRGVECTMIVYFDTVRPSGYQV